MARRSKLKCEVAEPMDSSSFSLARTESVEKLRAGAAGLNMIGYSEIMSSFSLAWDVLALFLIPIGGGIPAGVILGHSRSMPWFTIMVLYLVSDIILALAFEPIMHLVVIVAKRSPFVARVREAFRESTKKTTAHFGTRLGPLSLILISFGVDPMTGRAATKAAGHGFLTGWLLAITGDMLYFTVIMISTLWLNHILGDGTWATLIILALMLGVPFLVRRIRERRLHQR